MTWRPRQDAQQKTISTAWASRNQNEGAEMCNSVVTREGRADTCGELAALTGIELSDLPLYERVAFEPGPQDCLCAVNLLGVADMAGLVAFRPAYEDGDPMEVGMVPESAVRALLQGEAMQ